MNRAMRRHTLPKMGVRRFGTKKLTKARRQQMNCPKGCFGYPGPKNHADTSYLEKETA